MISSFPPVLNFNWLFLKLNRFIVTNFRFSPIIGPEYTKLQMISSNKEVTHFCCFSNYTSLLAKACHSCQTCQMRDEMHIFNLLQSSSTSR